VLYRRKFIRVSRLCAGRVLTFSGRGVDMTLYRKRDGKKGGEMEAWPVMSFPSWYNRNWNVRRRTAENTHQ